MEEMNASASATEVDEEMSVGEEKESGGKRPGRKGKKSKYTAHTADKYELYQHAVQSPQTDIEFVQRVYRDLRGEEAMHFREDFCGTAILSATWVKTDEGRTAEGYDLDPEYVTLAKQRLADEHRRLEAGPVRTWARSDLIGGDVVQEGLFAPDGTLDADVVLDRATASGKKVADIAEAVLVEAGFEVVKSPVVRRDLGLQFPFLVTDPSVGRLWYVEVAGAFTNARPGLRRADVLWRTLGRANVLSAEWTTDGVAGSPRLLVMTPRLPRAGAEGDRALRAVGGRGVFDVLELFDPAAVERLRHYAEHAPDRPLPGFWTSEEIDVRFA